MEEMSILDIFIRSWIPHFGFSLFTLLGAYLSVFLSLVSQDIGKCSYWDGLFDEFRAFISGENIAITEDKQIVLIKGGSSHIGHEYLCDFARYHELLLVAQNKVQRISYERGAFIALSLITSTIYATLILIVGGAEIKVGDVAAYFVPLTFIVIVSLLFFPIYDARNKISSFITERSKKEKELNDHHGAFLNISEL